MGKKSDGKGKEKSKGSQLVIRIDKAEREAFVTLCERLDTSAAREIRRFMRSFVAAHGTADPAASTADPAAHPVETRHLPEPDPAPGATTSDASRLPDAPDPQPTAPTS